jgi:hypothetical protein
MTCGGQQLSRKFSGRNTLLATGAAVLAICGPASGEAVALPSAAEQVLAPVTSVFSSPFSGPRLAAASNPRERVVLDTAAVIAGSRACQGRSPAAVRRRYLPAARRAGAKRALLAIAARRDAGGNRSRTVGIAAAVYSSTRPRSERQVAFAGCRVALNRALDRPVAKKGSSR